MTEGRRWARTGRTVEPDPKWAAAVARALRGVPEPTRDSYCSPIQAAMRSATMIVGTVRCCVAGISGITDASATTQTRRCRAHGRGRQPTAPASGSGPMPQVPTGMVVRGDRVPGARR